jgi:predicted dehydrogenase
VAADGAVFVTERRAPDGRTTPLDVPDSLGVLASLERGARVTYRVSTVLNAPRDVNGISIYGSQATLHWEMGDRMSLAPLGGQPEPLEPDAGTAGEWNVERDFVDSIRDGKPVELTNFTDGVHYMRVTEAVTRSRLEGRTVALDEV